MMCSLLLTKDLEFTIYNIGFVIGGEEKCILPKALRMDGMERSRERNARAERMFTRLYFYWMEFPGTRKGWER